METSTLLYLGAGTVAALFVFRTLFFSRTRLSKEQMMNLLDQGALILDVRSPQEFAQGHAPGSRNVPLDMLSTHLPKLDRSKQILVCCASGARSAAAKAMLERAGFTKVDNAGPWQRLLSA